jgi:hypothetical protein
MALARHSHRKYAPIRRDRPARPTCAATPSEVAKTRLPTPEPAAKHDDLMERVLELAAKAIARDVHITLPPPPANIVNINDAPLFADDEQ